MIPAYNRESLKIHHLGMLKETRVKMLEGSRYICLTLQYETDAELASVNQIVEIIRGAIAPNWSYEGWLDVLLRRADKMLNEEAFRALAHEQRIKWLDDMIQHLENLK